jgi:hypothetical protein
MLILEKVVEGSVLLDVNGWKKAKRKMPTINMHEINRGKGYLPWSDPLRPPLRTETAGSMRY